MCADMAHLTITLDTSRARHRAHLLKRFVHAVPPVVWLLDTRLGYWLMMRWVRGGVRVEPR